VKDHILTILKQEKNLMEKKQFNHSFNLTKHEAVTAVVKGVVTGVVYATVVTIAVVGIAVIAAAIEGEIKSRIDPEGWAADVAKDKEEFGY
jgi:hypothetical protein